MGCFKKTNTSSSSSSTVQEKTPEQKREEWIQYLNECHDYRHAQLEKIAREKYENSEHGANYQYDNGFAKYWKIWAKFDNLDNTEKLPWVAFSEIVDDLDCPSKALDYIGPINSLILHLEVISQNYTTDEDGEPKLVERSISIEDVVDTEKNPLLKFITTFDCFEYANDSVGSISDKFDLIGDVFRFITLYVTYTRDTNVLTVEPWLLQKETYINDMGTIRKEKSFIKKAKELSNNKEIFNRIFKED